MAESSKQWRLLDGIEKLQDGDEFLNVSGEWVPVVSVGISALNVGISRRPLEFLPAHFEEAVNLLREMVDWSHTSASSDNSLEGRAMRFLDKLGLQGTWTGRKLQATFCDASRVVCNWDTDNSIDRAAWNALADKVNQSIRKG